MAPKTKFVEGKERTLIEGGLYVNKFSFPGEKVLCFHGPLIYEAKALKHQIMKDKQVKYFIHYAGWNKK